MVVTGGQRPQVQLDRLANSDSEEVMIRHSTRKTKCERSSAFKSLSFRGKLGYCSETFNMKRPPTDNPRTYGGILRTRKGTGEEKYALVQGRYTGKWSFPKGHSMRGESALECCKREVGEETSIDTLPEPTDYVKMCYGHYFVFDLEDERLLVPRDTREIMNTRWVTLEEMSRMTLNADVSMYIRPQKEVIVCGSEGGKEIHVDSKTVLEDVKCEDR